MYVARCCLLCIVLFGCLLLAGCCQLCCLLVLSVILYFRLFFLCVVVNSAAVWLTHGSEIIPYLKHLQNSLEELQQQQEQTTEKAEEVKQRINLKLKERESVSASSRHAWPYFLAFSVCFSPRRINKAAFYSKLGLIMLIIQFCASYLQISGQILPGKNQRGIPASATRLDARRVGEDTSARKNEAA